MNENPNTVTDETLHAYLDGQLDGSQHDRIAAAVASDAELSRRADEIRGLNEAMHAAFDAALDAPVPTAMLRTVVEQDPAPLLRVTAAVAWMTLGGIIGGLIVSQTGKQQSSEMVSVRPLPREAAYAHTVYVPEVRHAVEVPASERAHLNAWLSKRLAHPVTAPDIRAIGYQLVGGRMLSDAGRPAAQFMYEDEHGERITLFVRAHHASAAGTALRHSEDSGVGVVYWLDGPLAYALAGKIKKDELERAAEAMYRALNP